MKTNQLTNQGLPVITMASHVALLWLLSSDVLPILALVNAQCDSEARASVSVHTRSHHYPSVRLTTDDCAFVYRKLEMFAPHLLGHSIPRSIFENMELSGIRSTPQHVPQMQRRAHSDCSQASSGV